MPFEKMNKQALPPRQWALVGHPGSGKSHFAAQMRAPILPIDADHRFVEVAALVDGEVLQLSASPVDHMQPERIVALLRENMLGSGVATVVVDSLTSILTPIVVEAILDNDAGRNRNRVSGFKDKALAVRLLQDGITSWGTDTLWIYHLRNGLDGQAQAHESTSVSITELARLRRSLNMQLRICIEGERRGIQIEWARRGRSGMTLWDTTGRWVGMPDRIEREVYGGLTTDQMNQIESEPPRSFSGPETAIAWGFEQGAFRDAAHAANAYAKAKRDHRPTSSTEMWRVWIEDVARRIELGDMIDD